MAMVERVFSGVQPTGNLHLGNYLGAIVNFVKLQETHNCLYCVVDMHAITQPVEVWGGPAELARNTREVTAAFIASGIDPKKHIVFNQSQVLEHAELAWIFNCVARIGWLNRMTQFKDKAGKDREAASVGLYDYPVLMAADILVYRATHVPVGEDQKQHLELSRDIAQKFNNDFSESIRSHGFNDGLFFPQPEPLITGPATRVMCVARRHQEDVEVGCVGQFADQPDRRRRHHRAENPQGEDRSGAVAVGGKGSRNPSRGRQSGRDLRRFVGPNQGRLARRIRRRAIFGLQEFAGRAVRDKTVADRLRDEAADGGPRHHRSVLVDGAARARVIAAETMRATRDIVGFVSKR